MQSKLSPQGREGGGGDLGDGCGGGGGDTGGGVGFGGLGSSLSEQVLALHSFQASGCHAETSVLFLQKYAGVRCGSGSRNVQPADAKRKKKSSVKSPSDSIVWVQESSRIKNRSQHLAAPGRRVSFPAKAAPPPKHR